VLDYKSGSTKEAQKSKNIDTLNDLQMSIYFQMLSPKYQNINLAFVKLFENGEIEEITALEEKNERLSEVIAELKQTKSFVAEKCEDLQKCKWCEFRLSCMRGEYYQDATSYLKTSKKNKDRLTSAIIALEGGGGIQRELSEE
jgi:CRISPR/Cas system-associated exonuclease Cas4 (RecB family)